METLESRLDAIDLLLKDGRASPAVILTRPVIEHMVNVMLIDNGLWKAAMGNQGVSSPKLSDAQATLTSHGKLEAVFGANGVQMFHFLRNIGNSATHNNDVDLPTAVACRALLDSILPNFAQLYPDELHFHAFSQFSKPVIDVTRSFLQKRVAIKSRSNKRYVAVDNDSLNGDILCQASTADRWEWVDTEESWDGNIGFRTVNGKYLSVNLNDGATLRANGPQLSGWERFRVYKSGNDEYLLSVQNGNFLTVHIHKVTQAVRIDASSPKISDNETTFLVKVI